MRERERGQERKRDGLSSADDFFDPQTKIKFYGKKEKGGSIKGRQVYYLLKGGQVRMLLLGKRRGVRSERGGYPALSCGHSGCELLDLDRCWHSVCFLAALLLLLLQFSEEGRG
jgi:hypothetical protein